MKMKWKRIDLYYICREGKLQISNQRNYIILYCGMDEVIEDRGDRFT